MDESVWCMYCGAQLNRPRRVKVAISSGYWASIDRVKQEEVRWAGVDAGKIACRIDYSSPSTDEEWGGIFCVSCGKDVSEQVDSTSQW